MVLGSRSRLTLALASVAFVLAGCCGSDCIKKPPCGPCEDPCDPCTWVKKDEKKAAKPADPKATPPSEPLGPSTPKS